VHSLAGQDGIGTAIGHRDFLRAPGYRPYRGEFPAQLGEHVLVGFDGGDVSAEANEGRSQLAGSGADIDNPERPAGPDWLQGPPDRGLGVTRAVLRVGGSDGAEGRTVQQPIFRLRLSF